MRGDAFADASPTRGIATCNPHGFVGNRLIEAVLAGAGGGKGEPRLAPTPVLPPGLQEGWAQRQNTILAALSFPHSGGHSLGIDVADLVTREVAAAPCRGG